MTLYLLQAVRSHILISYISFKSICPHKKANCDADTQKIKQGIWTKIESESEIASQSTFAEVQFKTWSAKISF